MMHTFRTKKKWKIQITFFFKNLFIFRHLYDASLQVWEMTKLIQALNAHFFNFENIVFQNVTGIFKMKISF